jgi:two-component system NtrC family sensor kinase
VSRPGLREIAEIASTLATGESIAAVAPGVLASIQSTLAGEECSLWLGSLDEQRGRIGGSSPRLRRMWSFGTTDIDANVVAAFLADDSFAAEGVVGVKLMTGQRVLGAMMLRRRQPLSPDERLFLAAAADMLASPLRAAEYARRLESEVVERTMEIEEQRRFTAKIIDSLPVGLYVIDREYRIQAWNRKRETGMQGVSREEAIGRTIFEILHRQPAQVLRGEFEDVFSSGRMQQFQIESSASGELRTYRITKIPMRLDDTDVTHVITIGEDVTEWRDAQERFAQAEKLAAIGTLAAGVMHEINNPLATIGASAESLALTLTEEGITSPRIAAALPESLQLIEHEVQRCKRIVDGVLDFSRPKQSERSLLDVNTVLEKTLFLLKHHSRFKKLTVDVQTQRVPLVTASEEQLVQVLMALLLNAMDAMHGTGTIVLRTRTDAAQATVIVEVVDHGEGIRGSELSKIFEPFYTTKPPGRGTGLGLSICYSLVADNGGRIEVESVVGKGSVFRIMLPAASGQTLRAAV